MRYSALQQATRKPTPLATSLRTTKFKTASLLMRQGGGCPLLFPFVFDAIPIVERDCIQNSEEGYSQDTHTVDTQTDKFTILSIHRGRYLEF